MTDLQQFTLNYAMSNFPSLDALDIMAFCTIESSWNPKAYRFEPKLNEASYGLMQILESTARNRGLKGEADQLFEPRIGLHYGCSQFEWTRNYLLKHNILSHDLWIAAYNCGVGNVVNGNSDVAAGYVEKHKTAKEYWRGIIV